MDGWKNHGMKTTVPSVRSPDGFWSSHRKRLIGGGGESGRSLNLTNSLLLSVKVNKDKSFTSAIIYSIYPITLCTGAVLCLVHTLIFRFGNYNESNGDRGGTVVKVLCPSRKVAGSIPAGVIGIFHWHNPSDRTMALGSTQPRIEMSTRSISLG